MTVEIIAEIAQGYEGNKNHAKLLLQAAAKSGATVAKFQLVYADELATPDYKYFNLFKSLEMTDQVWKDLKNYASQLNINIYFDIFGSKSLSLSEKLNIEAVKIHGTDIANIGLLQDVAKSKIQKIILGAGGAHLEEIDQAVKILSNKEILIFHGFQGYPTKDNCNQISRIGIFKKYFYEYKNVSFGFADHASPDSESSFVLPVLAIGMGATYLEKHLTLAKSLKMEDYESALNPDEFLKFTAIIKNAISSLGNAKLTSNFSMTSDEKKYRKAIRRHVVTKNKIKIGVPIEPKDLTLKRTSAKDSLTDIKSILNKKLKRSIDINKPILKKDIE